MSNTHHHHHQLSLTDVDALNLTASACEFPVRDIHKKFDIVNVVMSAITVIVVCARIFQKLRFERSLRLDDYLIMVCLATSIGNTISCVFGRTHSRLQRSIHTLTNNSFRKWIWQRCIHGRRIWHHRVPQSKKPSLHREASHLTTNLVHLHRPNLLRDRRLPHQDLCPALLPSNLSRPISPTINMGNDSIKCPQHGRLCHPSYCPMPTYQLLLDGVG